MAAQLETVPPRHDPHRRTFLRASGVVTAMALVGSGTLSSIAYAIDNTTKTRAVFEINKGVNKHREIDVNAQGESR